MRRALAVVAALAGVASANGRPPLTNGIAFRPGDAHAMYLRTTFGLLISHDDCTFHWVCEQNIGYTGVFDPKYAVASDGTIFATTYAGLRVSRDGGCTFTSATSDLPVGNPGRIADEWIDAIDIATNGDVWVTTADSGKPNNVYRSTDNGLTFAPQGLLSPTIWWKSVKVSPTDSKRIYVTGYEDAGGMEPRAHLMRSDDAGAHWSESSLDGVALGPSALTYVVATSPTDPNTLFLRSEGANNTSGDELYRSTDGAVTLQRVLTTSQHLQDVLDVDGAHVLVALAAAGTFESRDGGVTFARLGNWQDVESRPPQLSCLGKRGDELFGCGANWKPDYKALARSIDNATTWQKQLRFVELAGPLECPAGTPETDVCAPLWTGSGKLQAQFGATGPSCSGSAVSGDVTVVGSGSGGDVVKPVVTGGCCDSGTAAAASSIPAMGIVVFVLRRRRKRSCCS